jgi:hypothetical protein
MVVEASFERFAGFCDETSQRRSGYHNHCRNLASQARTAARKSSNVVLSPRYGDRWDDRMDDDDSADDLMPGSLLAEAVTGKIDAVLDQARDAVRSADVVNLYQLAQFVSHRHSKNDSWGIRELRGRIADLERRMPAGRKTESNGS